MSDEKYDLGSPEVTKALGYLEKAENHKKEALKHLNHAMMYDQKAQETLGFVKPGNEPLESDMIITNHIDVIRQEYTDGE